MIFELIPTWLLLLAFPVVVLGIWHLLFNSTNPIITKILVEGGYMLLGIPILILTFLSIPMMALLFWAPSAGLDQEVTIGLGVVMLVLVILAEYFWIQRAIRQLEEREGMSVWEYLKKTASAEERAARKERKIKNKEQSEDYFDEITEMNRKKRELDREEKEKLRRALLGDVESEAE